MADLPVQLFFKNNRDFRVGSITFDLILSESHSMSNQVTSHNVEDGSEITDHIKNNLQNGSLAGLITNFTLKVNGIISNRAQDAFEEMERLWKSRTLVTIATVMKVYENVAIDNVSVDRSESTGEAIVLNVAFRQIKTVKLKTVQVDLAVSLKNMDNDVNRQASPSADIGRTTGVTVQ